MMGPRAHKCPVERPDVNVLDLLLLAVAVPAAIGGWRLGLVARAASWLGLAVGLVVASKVAPRVVDQVGSADSLVVLATATTVLVLGAIFGQLLGLLAGSRLRRAGPGAPRRTVDRALGATAGVVGVVVATWLLLPVVAQVREWPAQQVRTSRLAGAVTDLLPDPPDTLASLASLIGQDRWADIVDDFRRELADAPPPPTLTLAPEIDARAEKATVRVEGEACGEIHEGTGFVIESDLVVTNAHVVAGMATPVLYTLDGRVVDADVVAFDQVRDLAFLQPVEPLELPIMALAPGVQGDRGVVYGYPEGVLKKQPYEIFHVREVQIRGFYDTTKSDREVYFLSSKLDQGDSGAPLVNAAGEVVGVAFATSERGPDQAFAVSYDELTAALAEVQGVLSRDPAHVEGATQCLRPGDEF